MIRHLFISPGHNFFGHHGQPPGHHAMIEVPRVECVKDCGLRGDRFFNYKSDYKGQVTFFRYEDLAAMWNELGVPPGHRNPSAIRRNVVTERIDLHALIGHEFEVQGLRFFGTEECRPCYWMNGVVHPEAEAWMCGRGGLRAKILSSGWLESESDPHTS